VWRRLLLLAVFCSALLLGGLAAPLYRNEGLRALLASEALATGSWVVPHLYGEPHLTKPPGMGVAIAACSWPFGEVTPGTARLPSVLAGLALIGMVGWAFARRFGTQAGLAAAALTPCSLLWLDRVPSAEIDLVQAAWVAGSLFCLLHAGEGPGRWGWWLGSMLSVAGGFFTKWTAPAFFYLTAVPWLWHRGRLSLLWSAPHLAAVGVFLALAGGWLVLAGAAAGWGPFLDALGREALMRLSPGHHPRPYPWGELATFPLSFLLGCLPLGLFLPLAWRPLPEDERQRALVTLAWCWLVPSLIFWALAPGHRPRHILPAQPAVAILAAYGWLMWRSRWNTMALAGMLALWLGVKAGHVGLVIPARKCDTSAARELARLVPPGEVLGLLNVKDENLMFAYGRPARRVTEPRGWCLMPGDGAGLPVAARLRDSQGAELALIDGRLHP
jgi:4-amino-4-deoxy-L-arabinose transferase-like glycosyltransferase